MPKSLYITQLTRLILILTVFLGSIYLIHTHNLILGFSIHLTLIAYLLYTTFAPNTKLLGPIKTHTKNNQIHLTIDDGPDPQDTPIILNLLAQNNIQATFFLIGNKAQQHPELVQKIHNAGHIIANHTQTHPQASIWAAGPWRTYREIKTCQQTLTKITGTAPTQYRAPVGHFNLFTHPILKHLKLTLTGWSARGYDAGKLPLEKIIQNLKSSTKPNTIILIHEATPNTKEILQNLLDHAQKQNLTFTPLKKTANL